VREFDKLELSTETLRDLSSDELGVVAGGVGDSAGTCYCPTINPVTYCFDVRPTVLSCITCPCG
jgi:hypothetical protein